MSIKMLKIEIMNQSKITWYICSICFEDETKVYTSTSHLNIVYKDYTLPLKLLESSHFQRLKNTGLYKKTLFISIRFAMISYP